ncbi:hypothetical protein NYQ10_19740 [Flavobacterium johnsoniae]|uniref:hypothetical protein n=1 Tax=Flavobacterium johnsoniae TaxID=986 RepID=UPI0025B1FDB9|nr:hypothetical protein [Flavobacterium johnsoniae]WJS94320.1 hypothetical protein NYQ10_19740 [Flavobacterium johnsoniae]
MAVKRSVLEQMSNSELEKYIKPETSFVPEATKIAFEILKTRGRDFSAEELATINILIHKKEEKKIRPIHKNHIKSSNFIFISLAIGIINFFLFMIFTQNEGGIVSALVTFIFVGMLGYLVRKGYDLKVFLLVLFLIGLLGSIRTLVSNFIYFPLNGILSLCQLIIQLLSIILLFRIPKKFESIKINEFESWLSSENGDDYKK